MYVKRKQVSIDWKCRCGQQNAVIFVTWILLQNANERAEWIVCSLHSPSQGKRPPKGSERAVLSFKVLQWHRKPSMIIKTTKTCRQAKFPPTKPTKIDFKVGISGERTGFTNSTFIKLNWDVDIKVSHECVSGEGSTTNVGAVFNKSVCSRNGGGAAGLAC